MKKIQFFSLLLLLACSCTTERKVARWIKNHGRTKQETVTTVVTKTVIDTVYIPGDTVVFTDYVHGDIDTVFQQGRVEIQYSVTTDTVLGPKVYIRGTCLPDTIYSERVDTVLVTNTTNVTVKERRGVMWYINRILGWSWLWLLLGLLMYVSYKILKRRFF